MTRLPNALRWASTYLTGSEIWGTRMGEAGIESAVGKMSVFDLLALTGSMSAGLVVGSDSFSPKSQADLVAPIAAADEHLVAALAAGLGRGQVLVHHQQIYHLARLALLHAKRRQPDDFDGGALVPDLRRVFFGIGDEMTTEITGDDDLIGLELRLTAINHDEDRMGQWSFFYEVFSEIWPQVDGAPDAEEAFRRSTRLSIAEYLALGFAVSAGLTRDSAGRPIARISISEWLARVPIGSEKRTAFIALLSSDVDALREALIAEERLRGPTTFGALAIEKKPLVRDDDILYVANFAAYERRATHGIFHMLSESSADDGLGREHFTTPFGAAFQIWGESCLRRAEGGQTEVKIFADQPYGPRRNRRDTPDVVLAYERNILCFELVAGALRIATLTHGDLESFASDLERFVYKKAAQLDKRIADIRAGETQEIGLGAVGIHTIWPIIVTSVPFPVRPTIMESIRRELKKRDLLQRKGTGPISIIGAEELAALEGYLAATGDTALDVIRGWKAKAATGDIYLKNYLFERCGGPIPRAEQTTAMFGRLMKRSHVLLFGADPSPEREAWMLSGGLEPEPAGEDETPTTV